MRKLELIVANDPRRCWESSAPNRLGLRTISCRVDPYGTMQATATRKQFWPLELDSAFGEANWPASMSLAHDPKQVFVLKMKLGMQWTMDTHDMGDAGRWILDAGAHMRV